MYYWTLVMGQIAAAVSTTTERQSLFTYCFPNTMLNVAFLEPVKNLTKVLVARALVKCIFRSRTLPDWIWTDLGPEFVTYDRAVHGSPEKTLKAAATAAPEL